MRVSEGIPFGRKAELCNPEIFEEHETVIVFTREEINRIYNSIMAEIDNITKIDLHLDRDEEWKLISYWPKIMQSVHNIDTNIDSIFENEPLQSYLDTYIYNKVHNSKKSVSISEKKAIAAINAHNLL